MKKAVAYLLPFMEAEKDALVKAGGTRKAEASVLMATVKGDVHDIGKNIVGVVLACNNYEVIDLGVMVSCGEDPRHRPRAEGGHHRPLRPDHAVAGGDDRTWRRRWTAQGFTLPLLIGGATTSKAHTAVKIAPAYRHAVVHVLDASRAVGVVGALKSPEQREAYAAQNKRRAGAAAQGARRGAGRASRCSRWRRRAAAGRRWTGAPTTRRALVPGRARLRSLSARRARAVHRLVALLPHLGAEGDLPADLREPDLGGAREGAVRRRAGAARADRGRGTADRAGGDGLLRRGLAGRRHPRLRRRDAVEGARDLPHPAPAEPEAGGAAEPGPGRFHRPRRERRARLPRPLRGHRRHRHRGAARGVRARPRRLQLDHDQGAGRPAGRGAGGGAAPARPRGMGLRARTRPSATTTSSASGTAASVPRPGIRPAPTTPRSGRCSTCWTPRSGSACSSPRASP